MNSNYLGFKMRHVSSKSLPQCLNVNQMRAKVEALRLVENVADFLSAVVITVEIWMHFYDPEINP